jgi:protein AaeX
MPRCTGSPTPWKSTAFRRSRVIVEIPVGGVLVPSAAVTGAAALGLFLMARALARRAGLYRLVWHPTLFDIAVFILLWAGVSALLPFVPAAWLTGL